MNKMHRDFLGNIVVQLNGGGEVSTGSPDSPVFIDSMGHVIIRLPEGSEIDLGPPPPEE